MDQAISAAQTTPPKKCADDWLCEPGYRNVTVLDPDGWDRLDFERSWAEEITEIEFRHRLMRSTSTYRAVQTTPPSKD